MPEAKRNGSTAASTGPGADQSRRKGIAGAVQQPGDDSPQSRRVHHELYLYFPECHARKTAEQYDRQPGTREAYLARSGRESRAVRSAIWHHQGITGRKHAGAKRRLRAVEADWLASSMGQRQRFRIRDFAVR